MTGRTHLVGGVASLWLLTPLTLNSSTGDAGSIGLVAAAAALGALLPDLDARDSLVKRLKIGEIAPFALPALLLYRTLGHRGLLHSALGLLLAALVAGLPLSVWLGWSAGGGLMLGYLSHLLLDACTPSGIPLRYPNKHRWHLLPPSLRVTTGSPEEEIVFALLAVLALGLLLSFLAAA